MFEGGLVLIIFFAVYVGVAYLIGKYGKKRKIGFWPAFLISLFISPIFGIVISFLLGAKGSSSDTIFKDVLEKVDSGASGTSKWAEEREYRNLQDSFASGEISKEEYEEVKKRLDEKFKRA